MTAELLTPTVQETWRVELGHLRYSARAAVSQPAGRPWRLWAVDRGVELRAESLRKLTVAGPGTAAVRVAAGAALLNMRIAMAAMGRRPVVTLMPDHERPRLLAILRRGQAAEPTPAENELADAITRAAHCCPDLGIRAVPDGIRNLVRRAAEAEGVWLRSILDDRDRDQLAAAVPAVAASSSGGVLMVIGNNHDVPAAHLQAGQAVQRVVLTAFALGFAAKVVAWPPDLRAAARLPGIIGGPGLAPQAVLAVGWPLIRRRPAPAL